MPRSTLGVRGSEFTLIPSGLSASSMAAAMAGARPCACLRRRAKGVVAGGHARERVHGNALAQARGIDSAGRRAESRDDRLQ